MFKASYNEIIGLAGSGKSYVRDVLVLHAKQKGLIVEYRQPINISFFDRIIVIFKVTILAITHPIIVKWWITPTLVTYAACPHTSKVVRSLKFRSIIESAIVKQILKHQPKSFVNDEGIIGKIVVLSILLGRNINEVIEILNILLPSDMEILLIEIEVEKAIKQMTDRNLSLPFWDEMEPTLRHKLCMDCNTRYLDICLELFHQKKVNFHIISNNGSKQELASSTVSDFDLKYTC
ncbi:MAG: hypothetical protein ACPHL3_02905 [Paracoccaceae bacterium]